MSTSTRAVLAMVAALAAAPSRAAAGPVDDVLSALAWQAPEGCPDGAEVAIRVATHLGAVESLATETMTITASVTGGEGRWHLVMQLQFGDVGGERVLDAPSCSELADSAALIIALAIDPTLGGGAVAAPAKPPVVAEVRPFDDEEPPRPRLDRGGGTPADVSTELVAPAPTSVELLVSAFAAADLGTLPGVGTGVGAALDVANGPWSVGVTGGYWFQQTAALPMSTPEDATAGADIYVIAAGARTCRRIGGGFSGCAGVELEWMHGQAFGFEVLDEKWSTAILALVDGVYRVGLGPRLTLRLDVVFAVAPQRAAFYEDLDGVQGRRIHQTGLAVGRSFASLEVAIP